MVLLVRLELEPLRLDDPRGALRTLGHRALHSRHRNCPVRVLPENDGESGLNVNRGMIQVVIATFMRSELLAAPGAVRSGCDGIR